MLTFTEYFLNITMVNGNKIFVPVHGTDHVMKSFRVSNVKGANSESYTTGQSSVPISTLLGRKATTITISSYWSFHEVPYLLEGLTNWRIVNNLPNVFLPGSILAVTNNEVNQNLPLGSRWLVDTYTYRRSSTRRGVIVYDLTLIEWHNELVVFDPTQYWSL